MLTSRSLALTALFAVLIGMALPALGADPLPSYLPPPTQSASDDIFRSMAYNAQRSTGDTFRPAFTTSDTSRLTMLGRFPFGNDLRHATVPVANGWSVGWTNDQYGRSLGFSRNLGSHGVVRFGLVKENIPNAPNRTAAGVSISYSFK